MIRQRADRRWEAAASLGWKNGKRHRKSFYGRTREEVQHKLTKALHDRQRGLPVVEDEKQTVGVFLERWLEESVKPSVRPLTWQQYASHVRLYMAAKDEHGRFLPSPAIGAIRLVRLEPRHVQVLMNAKLRSGLSPRTVQLMLSILRHALDQALKWGTVSRNVGKLVDPPRVKRLEIKPLTTEQARTFLNAAKGDRLEALYVTALSLGLREGEALGLRWQDVNLDEKTLRVQQAVSRIGGKRFGGPSKLMFVEPKSDRSRRALALPDVIVRALRVHRVQQAELRLLAGKRWQNLDLVFCTEVGTPRDPSDLVRHFKRMLANAELPSSIRFHDLRHSAASLLLAQGVPLRTIMEMLGHSTITLTANLYSHVAPTLLRDAADKMDAILNE
jgi:integrase